MRLVPLVLVAALYCGCSSTRHHKLHDEYYRIKLGQPLPAEIVFEGDSHKKHLKVEYTLGERHESFVCLLDEDKQVRAKHYSAGYFTYDYPILLFHAFTRDEWELRLPAPLDDSISDQEIAD